MFTEGQQRFLDSLSENTSQRLVEIKPWNPGAFKEYQAAKYEFL